MHRSPADRTRCNAPPTSTGSIANVILRAIPSLCLEQHTISEHTTSDLLLILAPAGPRNRAIRGGKGERQTDLVNGKQKGLPSVDLTKHSRD